MTNPNIDKFGHCVICHKNLLITQVIEDRVQTRFTADKNEEIYLMNDGSKMRVSICTPCKDKLNGTEFSSVMESVFNGWKLELEDYDHWDKEKKESYLKKYSELEIISHTRGKDDASLTKIFLQHKEKNKSL